LPSRLNFREILNYRQKKLGQKVLSNIEANIKISKKSTKPQIILCSGAISHWELRDPEVMISMATQLGLELETSKKSITDVPENIIKKIKERI
jgi:RNase P/RNase MRP subunit p30